LQRDRQLHQFKIEDHHDTNAAEKRIRITNYLRDMTSFIWVLEKKVQIDDSSEDTGNSPEADKVERWTMPVNPESASDIAKIS
jgi:hypothetical protein